MIKEMNPARIRWGCRRGMLELDILLLPFFEAQFAYLPATEQADFVRLLECTDPELYAWLMGHEQTTDSALQQLVHKIKQYALSQV